MALLVDGIDMKEEWELNCAPQCLTDILVQVRRSGDENVAFVFCIGHLLRETIEDDGDWRGLLQVSDEKAANLTRFAEQLEIYAALMRSALKCRRAEDSV